MSVGAVRVLLAEDHVLVRTGIRALLEKIRGVEVVGEASDGHEALQLIEKLRPDIVMMDIAMPELNGLEATKYIAKEFPQVRVIILSMHASEEYARRAVRAGASGYILKGGTLAELELALKAVANRETYLTPSVSKFVLEDYSRRLNAEVSPLDQLTPRQREILQLVAEGRTSEYIGKKLNISPKTVESHRSQIMDRLDIHDIAGLVRFAIRVGLVTVDA